MAKKQEFKVVKWGNMPKKLEGVIVQKTFTARFSDEKEVIGKDSKGKPIYGDYIYPSHEYTAEIEMDGPSEECLNDATRSGIIKRQAGIKNAVKSPEEMGTLDKIQKFALSTAGDMSALSEKQVIDQLSNEQLLALVKERGLMNK